jgi:hypothetical protein
MPVTRHAFGCPHCGAPFTPPLRALPPWVPRDAADRCCEVPEGYWSLRDDARTRPNHPVAVNPHDLQGVIPHPDSGRRVGCCGVSYRAVQPNVLCARCGAEAGYELTDGDHVPHAVFVAQTPCAAADTAEPDDDTLRARFEARRGDAGSLPADAGWFAVPERLRVNPDLLYDDPQDAALFPALHDLDVRVVGHEVRLALDGVWVRPPWPDGERDRVVALGAIPLGGSAEPLYWWADVPTGAGTFDRHQWHQWRVGDAVCVSWERWPNSRSTRAPGVGFQVPREHWEFVWRAALAPHRRDPR